MNTLIKKIREDLVRSLKGREELKSATLRFLLSAIHNAEKEKQYKEQKPLSEEDVQIIIAAEVKKRREAAEAFEKGGRRELADKEKKEREILLSYLPEQLSEQELRALVKEAVEKTGASSLKEMGKVMAELMPKVKGGRADGALVSRLVKESLS